MLMIFDEIAQEVSGEGSFSIRFFYHSSLWYRAFIPALLERFHVESVYEIEGFGEWEDYVRELREDLWD